MSKPQTNARSNSRLLRSQSSVRNLRAKTAVVVTVGPVPSDIVPHAFVLLKRLTPGEIEAATKRREKPRGRPKKSTDVIKKNISRTTVPARTSARNQNIQNLTLNRNLRSAGINIKGKILAPTVGNQLKSRCNQSIYSRNGKNFKKSGTFDNGEVLVSTSTRKRFSCIKCQADFFSSSLLKEHVKLCSESKYKNKNRNRKKKFIESEKIGSITDTVPSDVDIIDVLFDRSDNNCSEIEILDSSDADVSSTTMEVKQETSITYSTRRRSRKLNYAEISYQKCSHCSKKFYSMDQLALHRKVCYTTSSDISSQIPNLQSNSKTAYANKYEDKRSSVDNIPSPTLVKDPRPKQKPSQNEGNELSINSRATRRNTRRRNSDVVEIEYLVKKRKPYGKGRTYTHSNTGINDDIRAAKTKKPKAKETKRLMYTCAMCGELLQEAQKANHLKKCIAQSTGNGKRDAIIRFCPICNFFFKDRRSLATHYCNYHRGQKMISQPREICMICGGEYTSWHLKAHMKTHKEALIEPNDNDDVDGNLNYDDSASASSSNHGGTENGDVETSITSVVSSNTVRNRDRKTGVRPFACPYENCGKRFICIAHLNSHKNMQHRDQDRCRENTVPEKGPDNDVDGSITVNSNNIQQSNFNITQNNSFNSSVDNSNNVNIYDGSNNNNIINICEAKAVKMMEDVGVNNNEHKNENNNFINDTFDRSLSDQSPQIWPSFEQMPIQLDPENSIANQSVNFCILSNIEGCPG